MTKKNHNLYITNHRKPDAEISPNEFYSTHPDSVNTFLDEFLKSHKILNAWEPACGNGNIAEELAKRGILTIGTDLVKRDYNDKTLDFLSPAALVQPKVDTIITNPPFSLACDFIKQAAKCQPLQWIIMYLKMTFIEGKKRYEFFKTYNPKYIYVHSSRQGCSPEGERKFPNGGSVCFAWWIWDAVDNFNSPDTIIRRLSPND